MAWDRQLTERYRQVTDAEASALLQVERSELRAGGLLPFNDVDADSPIREIAAGYPTSRAGTCVGETSEVA